MNFLFSVCLDIGLVLATPVIIYQLLAFLHPIMKDTTRKFLLLASAAAGTVAFIGVVFGYFVGLPSALNFLLHQFTTVQVRPLITIQSYMQFVALYLFGSFGLTMGANVPRNNALLKLEPGTAEADAYWPVYVREWTLWNHIRTIASAAASVLYVLAVA